MFNRSSGSSGIRLPINGADRNTRDGRVIAFKYGAAECLHSAGLLEQRFSDLTGEYILIFHAIELGLKAYLHWKDVGEKELRSRKYGHDLKVLWAEAKRRGLQITIEDADGLIDWINEWHNDDAKIRYDFTQTRHLPACGRLFPLASAILTAVEVP